MTIAKHISNQGAIFNVERTSFFKYDKCEDWLVAKYVFVYLFPAKIFLTLLQYNLPCLQKLQLHTYSRYKLRYDCE